MSTPNPRDAVKEVGDLTKLSDSDGWKLIIEEYDAQLGLLTADILESTTPPDRAEHLRQARAALVKTFGPTALLKALLDKTIPRAKAQTAKASGGEPSAH